MDIEEVDLALKQNLGYSVVSEFAREARVAACCGCYYGDNAPMHGMRLAFTKKRQPKVTGKFEVYDIVARSLKLGPNQYATMEYYVADGKTRFENTRDSILQKYYDHRIVDYKALEVIEKTPNVFHVYLSSIYYMNRYGLAIYDRNTGTETKRLTLTDNDVQEYFNQKCKPGDYLFAIVANRLTGAGQNAALKKYFLDNPAYKLVKTPFDFANAYHQDIDNKLTLYVLQRV